MIHNVRQAHRMIAGVCMHGETLLRKRLIVMNKRTRNIIVGLVGTVGILAILAGAFIWFSGGSGEASTAISAPTLEPVTSNADPSTSNALLGSAIGGDAGADAGAETTGDAASGAAITFSIVPAESQVRFLLDEDLRGQRITVTGTTNQVAGQIRVNFADPAATEVGTIRINMRTLVTDNEFRDRAIRGQVLRTADDANEFSDFVPTAITGLPASVTFGQPFSFQIAGTFTVLGTPQPLTFDVTVTPISETRLEGSARAVINRDAWGLTIPSVPSVANVETDVDLELDFVAVTE